MKRQAVDYRGFRLSRIVEPQYRHLLLLSGWIVYFLLFVLTEKLIPLERCHLVHSVLDDRIPFREEFVVFYVGWYGLVFGALLYYIRYDVARFRHLQVLLIITQMTAMAAYILWPSRQDLRPEVFPRENVFTWIVSLIYELDTPTGVCPSLHVAYSVGIATTFLGDRCANRGWKAAVCVLAVLISLSTMFIKQHAALDVATGALLGLLAELAVRRLFREKRRGNP